MPLREKTLQDDSSSICCIASELSNTPDIYWDTTTVAFFAAGSKTRPHLESVSDLQVLLHRLQYKHQLQQDLQQPQSQTQQLHLLLSHK